MEKLDLTQHTQKIFEYIFGKYLQSILNEMPENMVKLT